MRKMISNNVITVKDGKVGTIVTEGTFIRGNYPATDVSEKTVLVSGITNIGTGWENAAGPFDYSTFEDGTLTLYISSEFTYANYVLRIGNNIYQIANAAVPGTFNGSRIAVQPVELKYHEIIRVNKAFKAFKLED